MKAPVDVPDDFTGMLLHNYKQFWFFGKGFFREYPHGEAVYSREGKRVAVLPRDAEKLRKLLARGDPAAEAVQLEGEDQLILF